MRSLPIPRFILLCGLVATLPALDLSKEIAAIKRIKDPPEDP